MLFLDLYGIPCTPADRAPSRRPHALRALAGAIADWRRAARDRRILSRMSLRQLEDLQLSWPDDIRLIGTHS
jgi:uncharacterized protein YjiS (DUF1127 family)